MPQNYNACFPATTPPTLYTGTGTTTTFATGFPSLKQNDVVVFTGDNTTGVWNQTPQTDYAVNSQNANNVPQVVFNTAPGQDVLIMRRTDLCVLVRNFQPGQSIRAQDLNNAFLQQLYLHQEMYSFLEQQFGGPLIPDGSTLQNTFWNKTTDTIDSGEAWVSDDAHIATTLAGDQRWLNATGGNVIGGDGITVVEGGGNVTISQETLAPSPAGNYTSANIVVDNMGRITSAASGGGGAGGGGITVVADVTALNVAFAATPVGDVVQVADTTNIDTAAVPAINFLPAAGTIEGGYGPNVRCNLVRAAADWTFANLVFPNTDTRYVNITGDTMTGFLTLNADPTAAMHAATRQYVDAQAAGGATVSVGINPPAAASAANEGDLWWNTNTGRLFVSFANGANNPIWTEASPATAGNNQNLQQVLDTGNESTTDLQLSDGAALIFENDAEDQTITLNADDATESYTVTLPPDAPTATGQVLRVSSGTTDAELEWGTIATPAGSPTGAIIMFGGATAPADWLICDGSAVSRTTQANLFAAIGTAFGAGDGSTTFNLPDMRGQFARGVNTTGAGEDPNRVLGSTQADATAINGLSLTDPGHRHSLGNTGGGAPAGRLNDSGSNNAERFTTTETTGITLSSSDTETRPTNVALNFIIRT